MPWNVVATGMLSRSEKLRSAPTAWSRATPAPARTTGCWRLAKGGGRAMHLVFRRRRIARDVDLERRGVGDALGDVLRHDDERGARPLGLRLLERLADHLGGGVAERDHVAPLRHRAVQRNEVYDLVRLLVEPVEPRLGHDGDEWVRVELGVRDPEDQVERARPERREADARLAGQCAVGVGHERRPAFVACGHEPDRGIGEGVDHVEVLLAGQSEDVLDPLVLETRHEQLRDGSLGQGRHADSLALRRRTPRATVRRDGHLACQTRRRSEPPWVPTGQIVGSPLAPPDGGCRLRGSSGDRRGARSRAATRHPPRCSSRPGSSCRSSRWQR